MALSFWFLAAGLRSGMELAFDSDTVERYGFMMTGVVFALAGPVITAKQGALADNLLLKASAFVIAMIWALALGVVATELFAQSF